MRNTDPRRVHGFTLIELMITVAIVGILAAVAYPSYQEHVRGTHRASAKGCLLEMAQILERRFTAATSYAGAAPALACQADLAGRYVFVTNVTATTFTIEARPQPAQTSSTRCPHTLLVNQTGTRTLTGTPSAAQIAACWN